MKATLKFEGIFFMINPTPTLSQVYSLLVQEERQRQVKTSAQFQGEGASFNASTTNFSEAAGQRRQEGRRSQLFCTHCKRSGHTVEKYYKLHGYPGPNKQGSRPRTFKSVNNAWTDAEKAEESTTIPSLPSLNQEQSEQLFQFLSNLTVRGGSKQEVEEASALAAYMAGTSRILKSIHCLCVFQDMMLGY